MATVLFSTRIGPSRESCVTSQTLEGIHAKLERFKKILEQNKLLFIGSIVEEIPGLNLVPDVLDKLGSFSGIDFLSQDGKIFH